MYNKHKQDATLYDPSFWTEIFAKAGAQYVVLTSKHHEGKTATHFGECKFVEAKHV